MASYASILSAGCVQSIFVSFIAFGYGINAMKQKEFFLVVAVAVI